MKHGKEWDLIRFECGQAPDGKVNWRVEHLVYENRTTREIVEVTRQRLR